jgi:CheY-like chemotaxis protein
MADPSTEKRRVLVVDDNEDSTEMLAQLLTRGGDLQVATANSGAEALRRAQEQPPHAVILDLGLPDIDGYAVLEQLRQMPALGATTFIALTGHNSREDQLRMREAGFDHHFVKPADLTLLVQVVHQPRA